MDNVNMEFITHKNVGSVGRRLLENDFKPGILRPWENNKGQAFFVNAAGKVQAYAGTATLRKDEWKHYDTVLVDVARNRLRGIADLISAGLVYDIPGGLGSLVLEYEDVSDMTGAETNMSGLVRGQNDRVEFDLKTLPMPITFKDFQLNFRNLLSSRKTGAPLDITQARISARKVAEKLETTLFQGLDGYAFGGGRIYGYTDSPLRNTATMTTLWTDSTMTGKLIKEEVLSMKQSLIDIHHYGPYIMYIPTNFETLMDEDYSAEGYGTTLREHLLKIEGISSIRVSDYLPANNVLLIQMDSETVRLVRAMNMTNMEWDGEFGFTKHFKVMACMVPQIRADQEGRCGIVHLAPAS